MSLDKSSGTIVRGPDGVLYHVSEGRSVPVTDETTSDVREPVSVRSAQLDDHGSSRIHITPDDFGSSRIHIDPDGGAAMDTASARIHITPDDYRSSRIHIEPGDAAPSRLTVEPGWV